MPDIQDPGPARKLQRRYRLIGSTPAPFLSPELVPVVLIDDLSDEAPTSLFAIAADSQVNGVGLLSQSALTNPVGSRIIVENVEFQFETQASTLFGVFQGGPALSSAAVEFWQDQTRLGSPAARVTFGTDVGAVTEEIVRGGTLATTTNVIPLPNVKLGENDRLHVLLESTDRLLQFWWVWSERAIE